MIQLCRQFCSFLSLVGFVSRLATSCFILKSRPLAACFPAVPDGLHLLSLRCLLSTRPESPASAAVLWFLRVQTQRASRNISPKRATETALRWDPSPPRDRPLRRAGSGAADNSAGGNRPGETPVNQGGGAGQRGRCSG